MPPFLEKRQNKTKDMHKKLLTLLFACLSLGIWAQIPNGYYDDAAGLSGAPLKTALFGIIDNHDVQSYNSLWDHFESTDAKPNGKVWDMYSDIPGGTPPYLYDFIIDQCGNYNSEGDCYNREHSFPKSWFNDASPMYSDLFQIVPTDGYVNGRRSNWPFGEVGSATWTSMNGSKVGSNNTSGYSGTVFEPIDEYKGDFARIYFYMATRYEDRIASWENNSDNSDAALDGTSYPCYEEWFLNLLLDWHQNDPVSQKEIDRNNEVYDIQDNRNPYVDHPEYVFQVWGGVQAPVISNVNWSPNSPDENVAVNVSATITDDGSISTAQVFWGITSSTLNNSLNMSNSGTTYSATIPGQSAGQMVYFKITATDDESNNSQSAVYSYQVNENAGTIALPFLEDFNDQTLGIFMQYSVTGPNQIWNNGSFDGTYFAKMSNYNGSENIENEDWMITPAINFNNYFNEKLQFTTAMKNFSDNNTFLYLKYSTNYSGSGNPNVANWTDLTNLANWSDGDYVWTSSGEIDLSNINGDEVYIAFIYDSQAGSGKTWEIDDISITVDNTTNEPPVISNVQHLPSNPEEGQSVTVSATITDDGNVEEVILHYGYSATSLNNQLNMNSSGDTYSAAIPAQVGGTQVFYQISATDDEDEESLSSIYNYTVLEINQPPIISGVSFNPTNPIENEVVSVQAQITDDNEVALAEVLWGLSAGSLNNSISMNHSGNNYNGQIPGQTAESVVYFKIKATDNDGDFTESSIHQYTVAEASNLPPLINNVSYNPTSPYENEVVNVQAQITDDHEVASAEILWGLSAGNLNQSISMNHSGNIYSGQIPGQTAETSVYFKIKATDDDDEFSESDIYLYTVQAIPNDPPQISNISFSPNFPVEEETVTVDAIITDDDEIVSAQILWGLSSTSLNNTVSMSNTGNDYSGQIPGQNAETTVYFKIKATDNDGDFTESSIFQYTVAGTSNLPPLINNVIYNPTNPYENEVVSVQAQISDDNEVASAEILWGLSASNLSNSVSMNHSGSNYSGEIPGQNAEITVYFKIKATDDEAESSESNTYQYTVQASPNEPPLIENISFYPISPVENETVTVEAQITDDQDVVLAEILWGFSSSNLNNSITMEAENSDYSGEIDGQLEETTVYFKIKATDNQGDYSISDLYQYTVASNPNLAPVITNVSFNPTEPEEDESVIVDAEITDDELIASALVLWGSSEGNLSEIVSMVANGDQYSGDIPGQSQGVNVFFKIQAFDNEGLMTETTVYEYTVASNTNIQLLPFLETFETEDLGIFHSYSVTGTNQWYNDAYDDNHFAKMSNYNGSVNIENEDWLITYAINFNNYTNEVMRFRTAMQDYSDNSTFLYLKYSTNYDGMSDPNTASWTDITGEANWSSGNYEWVESGDIDLSGVIGNAVYLAFQYVSEDGSGKTWEVDNVSVSLEGANQAPEITEITRYPELVDNTNEVTISAVITDDVEVSTASIFYGLSATQMTNEITMSSNGDDYSAIIPPQEAFETVYYRIKATDNEAAVTYSNVYNYFVDMVWGVEDTELPNWKLFPNPARNYIYLQSETLAEAEIKIFHSTGSLVKVFKQVSQKQSIDISNLSPGVYFVHINLFSNHQVLSLIVE